MQRPNSVIFKFFCMDGRKYYLSTKVMTTLMHGLFENDARIETFRSTFTTRLPQTENRYGSKDVTKGPDVSLEVFDSRFEDFEFLCESFNDLKLHCLEFYFIARIK